MISLRRFFHNPAIPQEYRGNFIHLYLDIGWFGILSGSAITFLTVYAARLGASGFQIGMLGAASSMVSLFLAIPAGRWLEKRPIGKSIFWTSVVTRVGYLLWIPLPWLFGNQGQIWVLVIIAFIMGIPLTVMAVGFNALFAAAVPTEWRAYVAGIRNVVLSVTFIAASLGSGYLLDHLPFPAGYQVVFGIGAFGALMSSLHLFFIRPNPARVPPTKADGPPGETPATLRQESPAKNSALGSDEEPGNRSAWRAAIRAEIWKTPFGVVLLVMLALHLTQFLPIPLFPLYYVNALHLTDAQIGTGTAIFYLTCLAASTQLNRIVRRLGHHKVTAFGFLAMSLYPILLSFSQDVIAFYLVSSLGGLTWAMVSGALANYLLEKIPEHDRPSHLAWYNIVLSASVLAGSLAGPLLARSMGLATALTVFGLLRLLAGVAILRWGDRG